MKPPPGAAFRRPRSARSKPREPRRPYRYCVDSKILRIASGSVTQVDRVVSLRPLKGDDAQHVLAGVEVALKTTTWARPGSFVSLFTIGSCFLQTGHHDAAHETPPLPAVATAVMYRVSIAHRIPPFVTTVSIPMDGRFPAARRGRRLAVTKC
jgi:hypothetical protein